jgi:hypothetical protein
LASLWRSRARRRRRRGCRSTDTWAERAVGRCRSR